MQSAANAKALSGAAGFSGLLEIKTPNETKSPSFVAHGTDFIGAVKKAETVRAVLEDDESELPGACVDAFSTIFFLDTGAASKLVAYAEEEA